LSTHFNESHSLSIRIWHWLLFVLITSSIVTVGLATYGFRTGKNITLVQQELQNKGITVDQDAARAVSHAFNDKLWNWHTWLGYGIAILVLARFIIEVFQPTEEKLRIRIQRMLGFVASSPEQQKEKRHYLGVKWTYLIFYLLILIMAITGLVLAFDDIPFFRDIRRPIKSLHSFIQYGIYAFILVHLIGVISADSRRRHPGLISRMINGGGANTPAPPRQG
jgi:cytochrome b561